MPGQQWGRVKLTEVNPHLVCVLCHGYFIDATTMAECPHSFCRACIVLYLETKSYCPICEVQIHKTKPHLNLKPDKTLQDIVYKLVPGLYHSEMKRRREFYAKHPDRDLYLGPEGRGVGVERIIYSPEDSISLSLEYYDKKEGTGAKREIAPKTERLTIASEREREEWASVRPEAVTQQQKPLPPASSATDGLKRYLQCPAAVNMRQLKKFIRLKYGLSQACTVEILYRRESLPDIYSLMDIAYIYTWKRNNPMRFYYRIHVPTTLRTVLPPLKASSEPIRDSTPGSHKIMKSPELLDAVGLRPKFPEETAIPKLNFDIGKVPGEMKCEEKSSLKSSEKGELKNIEENGKLGELRKKEVLVQDEEASKQDKEASKQVEVFKKEELKLKEERPNMTPAEDTAVSLLLALSKGNGHSQPDQPKQPPVCDKLQRRDFSAEHVKPTAGATPDRPPTSNGGVFKVPQTMTKRFVFNGGKLVPVKPKTQSSKSPKAGEKTKLNGKLANGDFTMNRINNPLGLSLNGSLEIQGGKLPPGSPRPPPNSEKIMKTKYTSPTGFLRLTPEITVSRNKCDFEDPLKDSLQTPFSQRKQAQPPHKTDGVTKSLTVTNGQPANRKEMNRLEQIVQNCLKKETSQKSAGEAKSGKETEMQGDAGGVKRSGTLRVGTSEAGARAARGDASIRPADHVAANPSKTDQVDIAEDKEKESSILKRKLNMRRPVPSLTPHNPGMLNGHEDAKRRLVTPDVSIELMANPEKCKKQEPSELSALTKRFLQDIQRMKKLESEQKKMQKDPAYASTVNIEKVPAPPSQKVKTPKASPNGNEKSKLDGAEVSSEEDQLFIDIRNKCEALKRKSSEPVSIAIERVSEDKTPKPTTQTSPSKGIEVPTSTNTEIPPKPSATHKKLPRLIEINAPPRPKLPALIPTDPKQKMGLKMTTVRKEVPIGKERPLVRKDSNGALDLSSGMSPPNGTGTTPKAGNKSPFPRPASAEKSPTSSSLSPSHFSSRSSFPTPDSLSRSPPIRIPSLKPRSCPSPRPSSLSSSSPSPPAEPRTINTELLASSAYQQLYRHQMELQSRILASQVNNNTWSNAKKMEEWMRLVNLPHHPLMYPGLQQLSPESARK